MSKHGKFSAAEATNKALRAFTILEVMIALALMATAIFAILSHVSTLQSGRKQSDERVRATMIAQTLMERMLSINLDRLCTPDFDWTRARFLDPDAFADDAGPLTANELVAANLIDVKSVPEGCRVFIEYYRGVGRPQRNLTTNDVLFDGSGYPLIQANFPGLLDRGASTPNSIAAWRNLLKTNPTLYRINPILVPANPALATVPDFLADPDDANSADRNPIVIRVIVTWAQSDSHIDLFFARTRN